ncbi:amidohydrolase family protein [Bizionia sediminis]|uniref:Amidohydrolase family protein n=1 Tax=Bizionia sediminis TaxID=1737064 RepID=A0ABW5KQ35_9FLAO
MKKLIFLLCLFYGIPLLAQNYFPKNDGVKAENNNYHAFTNATLHISPTETITNATLLINKGKVVASGKRVSIPENTTVINVEGKHIYPSFVDIYTTFGTKTPTRATRSNSPQYDAGREGYYWNDHIKPEQNAIESYDFDAEKATELREAGFGAVNTFIPDGIMRGTGSLIALSPSGTDAERILSDRSAQYLSTQKSVASQQAYPTSLMGAMALIRQVNYDADWYAKGLSETKDRSLEAFNNNRDLVQIIEAGSKLNSLRLDKVGDDVNTQYVIVGGGDEYELINAIKATNASFIIPIDFPDAFDMEDPIMANTASLADMREWNQKPSNPAVLYKNGVPFALTVHNLKKASEFMPNLQKAIEYGLEETAALAALTTIPAKIIGKSDVLGSLKNGAYANFLITSGPIFDKKTTLYENWVLGNKHEIVPMDTKDLRGTYELQVAGTTYDLEISGEITKPKARVKTEAQSLGTKISLSDNWLALTFSSTDSTKQDFIRLSAKIAQTASISGTAILPNGTETTFFAKKLVSETDKKDDATEKDASNNSESEIKLFPVTYPNEAYGYTNKPKPQTILFQNATVWTNESAGILKNTDVLVKDGKIAKIGTNLKAGNALVVDATGKHITSGIVDEHSHIATAAVNEAGQNSTAEVSIEDVIDSDDVNIYRNLAGGVTTIQILHGSANPIGGRSAIIKLKWGESPENLIFPDSPKFIKFALGENVKQSNWGDYARSRFPQTRMGVEQVYKDYFLRAKNYDALKKSGKPFRKDLELETLAEILNEERFISCHSYVQSEITMLMRVAEAFNFTINTFTHILEGYKVADKMKAHGVGASTFSDWWAYKYEVNDAIPYNAAILHEQGIVTAINSDDAEMSRRLNQEAAKAVKYGGVSEEEAWKMVTLNPAKLLHIDHRVGSIKEGKDADMVMWSGHPLSVYTKAEKTLIEGAVYFDMATDKQTREAMKREKNELATMMLQAKNKGLKTKPIVKKEEKHFHCDTL